MKSDHIVGEPLHHYKDQNRCLNAFDQSVLSEEQLTSFMFTLFLGLDAKLL